MPLDHAYYRRYFDGSGLPEAQQDEYISQLWLILRSFVDRAFGNDPTQICLGIDRQRSQSSSADDVESKNTLSINFKDAATNWQKGDGP